MKDFIVFLYRILRVCFIGPWQFYAWMTLLTVLALLGLNAYTRQLTEGFHITGMSDQVSWGVYIANFTFLVGMAAAWLASSMPSPRVG